ncbi:hypothetical protein H0H87_001205 [Tephrocybe sp. NHM501043]|nr:hypothetical protein H0H87_001205 [Tephrocybe sp. NHM501043]
MTAAPAPNPRASLLSGLRTGGVRSTSASIPHTAAPGATFNVPRFPSQQLHQSSFPEDDEDQLAEMPHQNAFVPRQMPMTAAVDGPNNRFSAQQMGPRGLNPNSAPFSPANFNPNVQSAQMQNQALQMQMLQLEAIQAQQMQAEMIAQAQRQQHQTQIQSQARRSSLGYNPPATAGPLNNSFDLRSATLSAQMRRANQTEQIKAQVGVAGDDQVPMTAALGGKFGSRTSSSTPGNMSKFTIEEYDESVPPPTPGSTTVISGGTSLGNPASNNIKAVAPNSSSKSDSVTSWRRGGNNNSVLSGLNRVVSSPVLKVTPPPSESQRVSPPPSLNASAPKFRPQPLRFSGAAAAPMPAITIDTSESNDNEDESSSGSAQSNNTSPTTPRSSSSNETSLSPREEAAKKLYEGLGIGRPGSAVSDNQQQASATPAVFPRLVSQPTRQPRGPPSGADELGPKNFATRIRRKAIGGLGMLMDARERRELVEAF